MTEAAQPLAHISVFAFISILLVCQVYLVLEKCRDVYLTARAQSLLVIARHEVPALVSSHRGGALLSLVASLCQVHSEQGLDLHQCTDV